LTELRDRLGELEDDADRTCRRCSRAQATGVRRGHDIRYSAPYKKRGRRSRWGVTRRTTGGPGLLETMPKPSDRGGDPRPSHSARVRRLQSSDASRATSATRRSRAAKGSANRRDQPARHRPGVGARTQRLEGVCGMRGGQGFDRHGRTVDARKVAADRSSKRAGDHVIRRAMCGAARLAGRRALSRSRSAKRRVNLAAGGAHLEAEEFGRCCSRANGRSERPRCLRPEKRAAKLVGVAE